MRFDLTTDGFARTGAPGVHRLLRAPPADVAAHAGPRRPTSCGASVRTGRSRARAAHGSPVWVVSRYDWSDPRGGALGLHRDQLRRGRRRPDTGDPGPEGGRQPGPHASGPRPTSARQRARASSSSTTHRCTAMIQRQWTSTLDDFACRDEVTPSPGPSLRWPAPAPPPSRRPTGHGPREDRLAGREALSVGLGAGHLRREALAGVGLQLDPHLEAEADDALDRGRDDAGRAVRCGRPRRARSPGRGRGRCRAAAPADRRAGPPSRGRT